MDDKGIQREVPIFLRWLLVLSYDGLAVVAAWFITFLLSDNFLDLSLQEYQLAFSLLPIVLCAYLAPFLVLKTYRGVWGYSSVADLSRLSKSILLGYCLVTLMCHYAHLNSYFLNVHLIVHAILLLMMTGGARIFYRRLSEKLRHSETVEKNVLIVGAGHAGEGIIRDILRNKQFGYKIVGILDDERRKQGQEIHRVRVLGKTNMLQSYVAELEVDLVILAMPSASSQTMRRLVNDCSAAKVQYRTLPGLIDIATGNISVSDLREVDIEDLLGRDQVNIELDKIRSVIQNKRVLVSGGGGSIGSELCRQIVKNNPKELLIIDNCEFNLYKIQMELTESFSELHLKVRLVDIADRDSLEMIFKQFAPELVFHAAAFKHVPLLEDQIQVAVRNNIFGSRHMADLSAIYGVQKFVQVSTDKAVNPTNIMGMTKRIAEIYCQDLNKRSKTEFITVRFGNVLGSVGSVVPLFKEQLRKGGPLTVTHKDMTRYFMTIPEAAGLILQAAMMGEGGEIFVLDMGQPVKISELAEQMIRLSGKEPGIDIEIQYTGLRPGEKLYEELFHEGEVTHETAHEKINRAKCREFDSEFILKIMQKLMFYYAQQDSTVVFDCLYQLVPEYKGVSEYASFEKDTVELLEDMVSEYV